MLLVRRSKAVYECKYIRKCELTPEGKKYQMNLDKLSKKSIFGCVEEPLPTQLPYEFVSHFQEATSTSWWGAYS